MSRDSLVYINDIYQHMLKIEKFVGNMTYEDFINEEKTHYAVIRCIEIIGEATKQIPDIYAINIQRYLGEIWQE